MNKTVVIHQPDFLPYLGFFHRLLNTDLLVILDDVQFTRRGWHHRDKIKTLNGEKWLTLSIKKSSIDTNINNIHLFEDNWKNSHLNLIKQNYKKAPYFNEIFPFIKDLYSQDFNKMIEFNLYSIKMLLKLFNINIKIDYSSNYNIQTKSNELIVDLLKKVDATHYLSGLGAKDYYNPAPYNDSNIEVIWQNFKHPIYEQINGEFISYLSSIDILFNCGIKESRKILRSI
jgi:hypothetical protein